MRWDVILSFVIVTSSAMNLELQGGQRVIVFVIAVENEAIVSTNMEEPGSESVIVDI